MFLFYSFRILLIALLVQSACNLRGQQQALKFITYTTNNGLLHNYTKKCVEDHNGFIWIVTETGLSRFDGVNFRNFQHIENDSLSLPHNAINDICVDSAGKLWVATEKGLCYYDDISFSFVSIDLTGTYNAAPKVLSLCFDAGSHAIWFMTDQALFAYDLHSRVIQNTSCKNPSPTQINQMYVDSHHHIWVALYRKGFLIYDISKDVAEDFNKEAWVTCFMEGRDQIMWIGHWHTQHLTAWNMNTATSGSYYMMDKYGAEKYMIISGISNSPFPDDSCIYVSTLTMGIQVFNTKSGQYMQGLHRDVFLKYSLPTDFTNYIFKDSRGILWVCTWNGLCKMNMQEQQFRTLEIPVLNTPMFQYYNLIEGIVPGDTPGTWWLGVNGSGLIEYDPVKKEMVKELFTDIQSEVTSLESAWIEFIIKTRDGVIWTGNDVGIVSVQNGKLVQYPIHVGLYYPWKKNLCIGPDGTFWISTASYLFHFDPKKGTIRTIAIDTTYKKSIPLEVVSESGFCSDGNIWTGTNHGLYQYEISTAQYHRIYIPSSGLDSLELNTINSLITDGKETIYLGTSAGFAVYNIHTKSFSIKGSSLEVKPVLHKSMLRDQHDNIWIYTPHALYKYDTDRDEFSKFTTSDGIYNFSSDAAHLFAFRNNFYIGYRGVITEFDPIKVNDNQNQVKPIFTEVLINNKVQKIPLSQFSSSYYQIPPGKKEITIHYTGIDFTNSDKITFSYRLNQDTSWHEAGTNRSVTYTNLPPGNYSFLLRARNSSGIITREASEFKFRLEPMVIQRWWFWPSGGLVFISGVLLIAHSRIRKVRHDERMKTEANKMMAQLETKLLRSQMNPHFIFNSLNSIQKYIWENKEEDAAEYLAQFAKLIRAILENSRKEFITLREEMDTLKLYISLEHRRSNGRFDYHIYVSPDLKIDELLLPPLLLQPYIENAIWHGVNKKITQGLIEIKVEKHNNSLVFFIDDDGVGRNFNQKENINFSKQKTSMGTEITRERIRHLASEHVASGVNIVDKMCDERPCGTTVIITIPFNVKHHA